MVADGGSSGVRARSDRSAGTARAEIVEFSALESLATEWRELAAHAVEANAFYGPALLIPALYAFEGDRPELVIVRDEASRLIGLAPIAPLKGYSRLPVPYVSTWLHKHCYFAAPLVRAGAERQFFRTFFDFVERRGAFLRLRHLDAEGPLHAAASTAGAETGRLISPSARYERAMLPGPWATDDYLQLSLRGKHRKDLRRRRARLQETGAVRFEAFTDGGDLAAWTEEFLALEAAGWKGANGTALRQEAASALFFREAVRRSHDAGELQFFRFRLGDRTIAAAVNFRAREVSYAFKIAYDESFSRYSPGVMIEIEIMQALEAAGLSMIDSCAKAEHPMIERLWRERRTIEALNVSRRDPAAKALFRLLMMLEGAAERARNKRAAPAAAEEAGDDL
jgi:CelD/BcsL family acetyltransferase involved in cellulose biosynthesis